MKAILTFIALFLSLQSFGQASAEKEVLDLSKKMFRWEVENKFDSLSYLFDDKLIIVGSKEMSKNEYLTDLRNGVPIHNSIKIEQASATINGMTAVVFGKGIFIATRNGNKTTSHLSYMKVFIKGNQGWKLFALHASKISD